MILKKKQVNVKDFGAKGNGIVDDSIAINRAIVYARDTGGTVYLPDGDYAVFSTIELRKYDALVGQSYEKTKIIAKTIGMSVLKLTQQEGTVKNMFITGSGAVTHNYTAIQIEGHNYVVDSVGMFNANKAIWASKDCYINMFDNLFMYNVNFGLYCQDGHLFNGNRMNIRTLHGSKYNDTHGYKYEIGDIGFRIRGESNAFTGGECAGFEYGIEIVAGMNNSFNMYLEHNRYGIKNTSKKIQDISTLHVSKIHPEGEEALRTENGFNIPGILRPIGYKGFNPMEDTLFHYDFKKFDNKESKLLYDYSGRGHHLDLSNKIIEEYKGNFGIKSKIIFPTEQTNSVFWNVVDVSKPLTIIVSNKKIKHSDDDNHAYSNKLFWISSGEPGGSFVRALQLTNGGLSIESYSASTGNVFHFTCGSGNNDSFNAIGIDFQNNRLIRMDLSQGMYEYYPLDLTTFGTGENKASIRLLWKDATPETVEYSYNFLVAYEKELTISQVFDVAKFNQLPMAELMNVVEQSEYLIYSPNGTPFRLTIDNYGAITTEKA